jgi:hypothetical protein
MRQFGRHQVGDALCLSAGHSIGEEAILIEQSCKGQPGEPGAHLPEEFTP